MNAQEDDGLLTPHTIQTLLRMAQNMPGQVKVCPRFHCAIPFLLG